MSEHPNFKVVTVVGTSSKSTDDAIRNAVGQAAGSLRHLGWFEVLETRGRIADGNVHEFQVKVEIGFRLEDDA